MGILKEIVSKKKERLKDAKALIPTRELRTKIGNIGKTRDFKTAIKRSPDEKIKLIAEIKDTYSFTTDTPDFWRREGQEYPEHSQRFTGEPSYFRHVVAASKKIMERNKLKPEDFDYVIFHQPNGKFPKIAAKKLGFSDDQINTGLLTPLIGNTYSGASPLGLAAVLDEAKADQLILMTSYGSGAGSDSFIIKTTKEIEKRKNNRPVIQMINHKEYIEYAIYAKMKGKIKGVSLNR